MILDYLGGPDAITGVLVMETRRRCDAASRGTHRQVCAAGFEDGGWDYDSRSAGSF